MPARRGAMRSSDKRKERKTSPLREVFSSKGDEALIEGIRYRFGTTRSGKRVHILYRLAPNAYTTLCRDYPHEGQVNKSLTIHDVDCKCCRKTLTYFRLLPEAQSRSRETKSSASTRAGLPPETMQLESKTQAGSEPGGGRAAFGGKVRTRPQIMFDSDEEIRCVFLTLVVKVESLRKKYKEGIGKFLEKYGARCNRNLAYLCAMGGEDLNEPIMDLEKSGLTFDEDFFCFDAAMKLLGNEMAKKFDKKFPKR